MNVVLGPVPCHKCGVPLVWNGLHWRAANGGTHKCHRRWSVVRLHEKRVRERVA